LGWFADQAFRGLANRSTAKLSRHLGTGVGTEILAIALAYACYPTGTCSVPQGHKAIEAIKKSQYRPRSAKEASSLVESWLDHDNVSAIDVFELVWGVDVDTFTRSIIEEFQISLLEPPRLARDLPPDASPPPHIRKPVTERAILLVLDDLAVKYELLSAESQWINANTTPRDVVQFSIIEKQVLTDLSLKLPRSYAMSVVDRASQQLQKFGDLPFRAPERLSQLNCDTEEVDQFWKFQNPLTRLSRKIVVEDQLVRQFKELLSNDLEPNECVASILRAQLVVGSAGDRVNGMEKIPYELESRATQLLVLLRQVYKEVVWNEVVLQVLEGRVPGTDIVIHGQ
jgi:hypothetical protein